MTHIQDEGHYQEMMNAQAQAEMEAQMFQMEGEAEADAENQGEALCELTAQPDWQSMEKVTGGGLSFGEKLVGYTFNPSGDAKVQRAKELCSQLADLVHNHHNGNENASFLEVKLYQHTIGEILNAQMNAVKVLTFKD
jgi:hypothetical protein